MIERLRQAFVGRIGGASPRVILLAGWFGFLIYDFPGYMVTESADELLDARAGAITDWHSPVLTEIWHVLEHVVGGPPGMLFLQSLLFLIGSYRLLARVMPARGGALATSCLLLFPPVMAPLAVIWAEAQMAGFLVAGTAALTSTRVGWRIAGLGLLVVAAGLRSGGIAAVVPLIVLGFVWRQGWQRYAVASVTALVVSGAALLLRDGLIDAHTRRNEVLLAGLDITGVITYAPPVPDAELREALAGTPLVPETGIQQRARSIYSLPMAIFGGDSRLFDLSPDTEDNYKSALIDARVRLARGHPRAYLAHRWHQFLRVLGVAKNLRWSPVVTSFTGSPDQRKLLYHAAHHSPLQEALIDIVEAFAFLCKPYLYLALALVMLPVAIKRRQLVPIMLIASGVAYELSLFFSVESFAEYRFSHWLVVSSLLAAIWLAADLLQNRGKNASAAKQ